MLSFLRRFFRAMLVILGLLLVALFIWYAGPYFAFADYHPFEPATVRLVARSVASYAWA